jgi:membrane-associated PAP2 superfamily phosphatase
MRTCIALCDFKCYKRLWLIPSLDTNWFLNWIVKDLIRQMVLELRVTGLSRGSVTLREGLLRCNNAALLTWTALITFLVGCDFECHRRLWLSPLNTN